MNQAVVKAVLAVVLFSTWVLLVVYKVPGSEELITYIKAALAALGAHTLTVVVPKQPAASSPSTAEQVSK